MYTNNITKKHFLNGKKIGEVSGEIFSKEIRGSKHIMRNPHAIFFDIQSLREVESLGAKYARVTDKETGNVYTAALSLIWDKAIYKNYGYGEQVGLSVNLFAIEYKGGGLLPPTKGAAYSTKKRTVKEKRMGQLSLFGGRG
jgi:hypothetical protein